MDSENTLKDVTFKSGEDKELFPVMNDTPWTPYIPKSATEDKPKLDISLNKDSPPRVGQITIKDNNHNIGSVTITAIAPREFMTYEEISELNLKEDEDEYIVTIQEDKPLPYEGVINFDVPYMVNSITITLMDEESNGETTPTEVYSVNVDIKACQEGIPEIY